MWRGYELKERETLKKIAWINAEQYNSSGFAKRQFKPQDFLSFDVSPAEDNQKQQERIKQARDYDPVKAIRKYLKKADPEEWHGTPPWELDDQGLL